MNLPKAIPVRKSPANVYLRFGLWERRSMNWGNGTYERGISAYPAVLVGGVADFDWDDPDMQWGDMAALEGRLVFVVTGREVCKGSDGEPVLQGVICRPFAISPLVYTPIKLDAANERIRKERHKRLKEKRS